MKTTKAFTLIELLVVVLIIGILAAVALPQYQKAVWKSRTAEMASVLSSLANAEQSYFLANNTYADFDDLDIEFPLESTSSGPCHMDGTKRKKGTITFTNYMGANIVEGDSKYTLAAAFNSGKYQCAGLFLKLQPDSTINVPAGLYCWECTSKPSQFCKTVMQMSTLQGTWYGWNIYK